MKIHPIALLGRGLIPAVALAVLLPHAVQADSPTAPVAEAGYSRYAAEEPIQLDGTGSYDPDGDAILGYEWAQVSGPEVEISDADTAKPVTLPPRCCQPRGQPNPTQASGMSLPRGGPIDSGRSEPLFFMDRASGYPQ